MTVPTRNTNSVEPISHSEKESTASAAQENGDNHDKNSEPLEGESVDTNTTKLHERSVRHLEQLDGFRARLESAAQSIIDKRTAYKKVVALITVWENAPGLKHMETHAKRLHDLFKETYKFDTEFYAIPEKTKLLHFVTRFQGLIDKVMDNKQSLLIFYYGGHAEEDPKKPHMLIKSSLRSHAGSLDFTTAQETMFESTQCDKLFLLDCCHSGKMISKEIVWQNATELLGASSGSATASAKVNSSFTRALVDELKEPGYDIWTLWATLSEREKMEYHGLEADPYYYDYSGRQLPPISMQKFDSQHTKKCDLGALARSCSNARMLIKVTFRSDAENLLTSWQKFFSNSPHEVAEYKFAAHLETNPILVALFESNSCTAIITLPVWLWAGMIAGAKGYEALAIIRSDNFVDQWTKAKVIAGGPRDIVGPSAARDIETGIGATRHDDLQIEPVRAVPSPPPTPKLPQGRAMQAELERFVAAAPTSRPQDGRWRMKLQNEVDPDELERKIGKIGPPLEKIEKGATKSMGPDFESPKPTRFPLSFWRKPKILPVTPSHHPLHF